MQISDELALGALLRLQFGMFLRYAVMEVGGGREYQHNWHIDAIAYQLDRILNGENTRLIATMPPRHLKSVMITTAWVAWMLGNNPQLRVICVSYGKELAERHARDCMRIMQSAWYQRAFPKTRLARLVGDDFETTAGGGRMSTSVGGVLTGRGADIIIIDDPMKADDASSEAARLAVRDWYYASLASRLDDKECGSIILVMQRLHEADLAGELISQGGWHELRLAAIAESDELIPLGLGRFHQRLTGQALHPARESLATLKRTRANEPFVFAAQYQQDPLSRIGSFVQADWFTSYIHPPQGGTVMASWDTAVKKTVRSDWSVGVIATYYMNRFYILDVFRKRVEFDELKRAVVAMSRQYGVTHLLIEDASSGQALIQQLREEELHGVAPPIAIKSTQNKVTRFEAQAGRIKAGSVGLPQTAPWLADFVGEVVKFPNGRHDDQADALAQLLDNPPVIYAPINAGAELITADDDGDGYTIYDGDSYEYVGDGYDPL